jgi:hypothetical protein
METMAMIELTQARVRTSFAVETGMTSCTLALALEIGSKVRPEMT